jgi:hypothetical protein
MMSEKFWTKIEPLLPLLKPKKEVWLTSKDDKRILNGIFYLLLTVANGNHFLEFMELQALSTIDFRTGEKQDSLKACG